MVAINKKEADMIREKFPDVHVVRTMMQHSERHRYYCEETRRVMKFLSMLRNPGNPTKKEGTGYTNKQKRKRVSAALS